METRQILERALERYESGRYRWGRGTLHKQRKVQGEVREYVCLLGSLQDQPGAKQNQLMLINDLKRTHMAEYLLLKAIFEIDPAAERTVAGFNDSNFTTKAKAMQALRRAIELAPNPVVQASEEELSVSGD